MTHKQHTLSKTAVFLTILIGLLALISLLWIGLAATDISSSETLIADIYQDGQLIRSIPLDNVKESYTFTITGINGCRNEIQVCPGSIGIISADCPDKLCVKQGLISTSLLPITCLPNRLVIQLRPKDSATEHGGSVDMVTY